jgi:hypothetical protein
MAALDSANITVRFSRRVARVIECETPTGLIQFAFDGSPKGPKSLCLEHHAPTSPRSESYTAAFEAARRYLVARGYEVEVYGA